jgi:alpha-tubulin suppressor-like RCC1 family protein
MALQSMSEPRDGRRPRRRIRSSEVGFFAVVLLCLGVAGACRSTGTDLKEGLRRAAKGADLRDYTFASSEDDSQAIASFTSGAIKDRMTLTRDATVVARYQAVHDKKNDTTTYYRDDIVRKGRLLTFVRTDLGTNRIVNQQSLDITGDGGRGGRGGRRGTPCPSCADAQQDFDLNHRPALQAEANRTCRVLLGGYSCCDNPPCETCLEVLVGVSPGATPILEGCWVANFPLPDEFSLDPTVVALRASVIGAGDTHSLAIAPDGAVLAWGSNADGQLGDGTRTTRFLPTQVAGLGANSNVIAVAGGRSFSLALKSDGTVLAWGTGGDGTSIPKLTPVTFVAPGTGARVKAIAAGAAHALALKSDGKVWAWGKNQNGQLGIAEPANSQIPNSIAPVQVADLADVQAIAASGTVSAALTSDGKVFAWGNNAFGQLGTGDTMQKRRPFEVTTLGSDVRAIVIGAYSVALKLDGSVFTWGTNSFGSLGLGVSGSPDDAISTPGQVIAPGSGIIAIAGGASGSHVLALKSDGTVLAWGANSAGQIGDDTTINRFGPTPVPGLGYVTAIAVGASHSLARTCDGTVLAWGSNGNGQLGDGTIQASVSFVNVAGLDPGAPITSVSACANHVLARRLDGRVVAWGSNGSGQLGNENPETQFVPVLVNGLPPGVKAVACGAGGGGGGHSLALTFDGKVFAWGANANGQLGDGTNKQRALPLQVPFPPGTPPVKAIAAGGLSFSFALLQDGTVWAWGTDTNGQLGNRDPKRDENHPVQVFNLEASPVKAIAAGNHGLALREDDTVWAWGGNSFGQLGNGTTDQTTVPVPLTSSLLDPALSPRVIAIEAAANYSLALRGDGSVLGWGANASGQLGDGSTTERHAPVVATALVGRRVASISIDRSEGSSSFVTLTDGTVLGFGSNATGQLADGTFDSTNIAHQVGPFGVGSEVTVRAGTGFLLVLRPDGVVFAVGTDGYGQLGDGQNTKKNQTPSPVLVLVNP